MEPGSITLDRESFRALASEVRVEILKQIETRRMTVTDLSRSMNLAKPTLLEHLNRLLSAGLVSRADEGRKWIYYDLTKRGRNVLHPHQVKIMISLALSVLLFSAGIVAVLAAATAPSGGLLQEDQTGPASETGFADTRSLPEAIVSSPPGMWGLALVLGGGIVLLVGLWYLRESRRLIESVRDQLAASP